MPNAARKNSVLKVLDVSFLLGAASTVGFYAVMMSPAMKGTLIHRCTTEHIVDYVIVSLFFWGLMDVLGKLLAFPREIAALRYEWIQGHIGREDASARLIASMLAAAWRVAYTTALRRQRAGDSAAEVRAAFLDTIDQAFSIIRKGARGTPFV